MDRPITRDDVRSAKEFLRKRGIRGISPRKFARAAVEAGSSYRGLVDFLSGVIRARGKGVREGAEDSAGKGGSV